MKYKFIYEDDETGNALYDYCTNCKKPVLQEDLGDGVYGCEYCKSPNHIEIREVGE
jgi:DNA-directed RNA polymerase subunit RPC12/RpoP